MLKSEFVRSSYCSAGACVEVAVSESGQVLVRDNKDLAAGALSFTAEEWRAFVSGVKNGEFDLHA
ncbi:protein of unknown function [Pseudonocardia oroxyli]|uniref:DUF397 domain-containing protein n=1 Tax=Pseudonocardia oroxyli TaxID=366584 RepID=A0A1G7UUQ5_PSEOR|nr:protein of unknown function [Pseudonocardia oroxyli]